MSIAILEEDYFAPCSALQLWSILSEHFTVQVPGSKMKDEETRLPRRYLRPSAIAKTVMRPSASAILIYKNTVPPPDATKRNNPASKLFA